MENYNFLQKMLHDFVLGNKIVNKILYDFEKLIFLKDKNLENKTHIFISGLPRSGTTSLLNFLYSSKEFASLKYSNMPFILSPNFSKIFNKNKNVNKNFRLHSDDILYDLESPESFDEVFFKNGEKYIRDELLNFLKLILISDNKDKYLSKNNLNYKRINLICSILPNCKFLIPIRDPIEHSNSLLNQHKLFIKLQKNNDFIRRYMNYIGHNEFGIDHLSWNKPINYFDFNDLNYWLEQWILFYQSMMDKFKNNKNCLFIKYEYLIDNNYLLKIIENIDVQNKYILNQKFFKNKNKGKFKLSYDTNLHKNAKIIYQDISI